MFQVGDKVQEDPTARSNLKHLRQKRKLLKGVIVAVREGSTALNVPQWIDLDIGGRIILGSPSFFWLLDT